VVEYREPLLIPVPCPLAIDADGREFSGRLVDISMTLSGMVGSTATGLGSGSGDERSCFVTGRIEDVSGVDGGAGQGAHEVVFDELTQVDLAWAGVMNRFPTGTWITSGVDRVVGMDSSSHGRMTHRRGPPSAAAAEGPWGRWCGVGPGTRASSGQSVSVLRELPLECGSGSSWLPIPEEGPRLEVGSSWSISASSALLTRSLASAAILLQSSVRLVRVTSARIHILSSGSAHCCSDCHSCLRSRASLGG